MPLNQMLTRLASTGFAGAISQWKLSMYMCAPHNMRTHIYIDNFHRAHLSLHHKRHLSRDQTQIDFSTSKIASIDLNNGHSARTNRPQMIRNLHLNSDACLRLFSAQVCYSSSLQLDGWARVRTLTCRHSEFTSKIHATVSVFDTTTSVAISRSRETRS